MSKPDKLERFGASAIEPVATNTPNSKNGSLLRFTVTPSHFNLVCTNPAPQSAFKHFSFVGSYVGSLEKFDLKNQKTLSESIT